MDLFRSNKTVYSQVSNDVELSTFHDQTQTVQRTTIEKPSWYQQHFTGWRFGILNGAILALAVLILNVAVTLVPMGRDVPEDGQTGQKGRRLIFEGDCGQASRLNVLAHLLINALSTILLSASNYGMQVLSAPTRSEIDYAHVKKKWLDIGVLSIRNLKSISRSRAIVWFMLTASSLPLHLL